MDKWKHLCSRFHTYAKGLSFWKAVLLFLVGSYIIVLPFVLVEQGLRFFFKVDLGQSIGAAELFYKEGDLVAQGIMILLLFSIFGPFLETMIAQVLPIRLLLKIKPFANRPAWIIVIAAFLFGLAHYYDLSYVIHTFFIGLVLNYMYYPELFTEAQKKKSSSS